jgi:hypothetical protein
MFIPDPNFSIPDPGSKKIPDPGSESASKNLSIFNPKNCFYALGKIIWDVHPGSRIATVFESTCVSQEKLLYVLVGKYSKTVHYELPDSNPQLRFLKKLQLNFSS